MQIFREYIVKLQVRMDMHNSIDYKYNKVIIKECIEYYHNCWKERYKTLHDSNKQQM